MSNEPNVVKNLLIALAVLVLGVFAFVGYNSYISKRHQTSNEVFTDGGPAAGDRAGTSARRDGAGSGGSFGGSSSDLSGTPTDGNPAGAGGTEITAQGARSAGGMTPPATDSIQPDPPNGMTFGGSGHYQLYRQGNLTWRLNTDNGQTCIVFATEEEWRKPKVFQAGCRGK